MIEEFIKKYKNLDYISNKLYSNIKLHNPDIIPSDFNINFYNEKILEAQYSKYKEYFENLFNEIDKNIHLDEEQIKSILADEDYSLVLAGAGTGKTTTIVAKVKYLVDIKHIDPKKILVISYTKKATEELEKRIVIDFNIPVNVATFHSLGYKIIKSIYKNNKPYVVDSNVRRKIFTDYFKKIFLNKAKIKELINVFTTEDLKGKYVFPKHFVENYELYNTWDEYFENYKKSKIKEVSNIPNGLKNVVDRLIDIKLNSEQVRTINGELVKSKGEALIANFFICNNIEYNYEKVYEHLVADNVVYKPDFTLNLAGENVYVEYFGLSNYKNNELSRYNKIRKIKEDYHKKMNNKFIAVDYHRGEDLIKELAQKLKEMGFIFCPISYEKIYDKLLSTNELASLLNLETFFYDVIDTIKSSLLRDNINEVVSNYLNTVEDKEKAINQHNHITDFYRYYNQCLFGGTEYGFDYGDLIYWSKKKLSLLNHESVNYEYVIIDEYQDISFDRYELTNELINRNNSKIVAVGDDWQTIFSFVGSKIEYIYNFKKYYQYAKIFSISKTYRNSQELVNYSGEFIMKNNQQLAKTLISDKEVKNPIKIIGYDENQEINKLKELITFIHRQKPNDNILILSRYNSAINSLFSDEFFKDDINTKIKIKGINDIDVDAMSIHKSKGLSADEVIIIGLNKNFPSNDRNEFWLKQIFKSKGTNESMQYAEERRIFYVALTRTKNYVFLLTPNDAKLRSAFVTEMIKMLQDNK